MGKFKFNGNQLSRDAMKQIVGGTAAAPQPGNGGNRLEKKNSCEQAGGSCKVCQETWCQGQKYCSNGLGTC